MKDQILESYKKNKKTYHAFRERVVNLLTDLLAVQEIVIHHIGGRTKTLDSLSKKIDDKGEKYNSIDDITDIVGIRIITYMESDVDSIAKLIEKEFIKDIENSIDKRILKADQFGYRSFHIVASLNEDRCNLKEYKKYNGIKCEIQVRSILQHAWAEIEHDLGYKGEVSIPDQYKRTFNRLSALLETADIEFDRLKTELKGYENIVSNLIKTEPDIVDINSASISSFITTNNILMEVTKMVEEKVSEKLKTVDNFDKILRYVKYFNFVTIGELEKSLKRDYESYTKFVSIFLTKLPENGSLIPLETAPLLYYLHFLAGKSQNLEFATKYVMLRENPVQSIDEDYAKEYIKIYNSINT